MTERDAGLLGRRKTWAAGALLLTTLALGVAFAATSWSNYRGARIAYQMLNRGHVAILENALRRPLLVAEREGGQATLEAAVVDNARAGLRYIALTDSEGNVEVEAGEASGPIVIPTRFFSRAQWTGIVMVRLDGRIRAFLPRRGGGPPLGDRPGSGGPGEGLQIRRQTEQDRQGEQAQVAPAQAEEVQAQAEPGPAQQRQPRAEGPRTLEGPVVGQPGQGFFGQGRSGGGHTVIEFEPAAAMLLVTQARRSMLLGSLVAALLTLAAVLFWRLSARYDAARADFEQQRRLSQLGEMSAVLAHEIRNPLASLKGNAQLLAEHLAVGSRDKAKADRVVAEATRLEALTGDLLEFARTGPIERRLIDPATVAEAAIREVGADDIELDRAESPAEWGLDASRLHYALVNVLQNAVQASPDRSPIVRISTGRQGSLVFEVRDFGPGIQDGTEEQLFEPFFTTRTKGTGLGLAVARRAAEFHGGNITARNHPEGGAVFEIVIP